MDLINKPKDFCTAPWTALSVAASGGVRPCCLFSSSSEEIAHSNLRAGDTLQSAWDKLAPIRQDFIDGKRPSSCNVCWTRDDVLGNSRIQWYDKVLNNVDISSVDFTNTNPLFRPFQMDFNFSNKCNLKCRMCGSWGSTAWFKEETQLNKISLQKRGNPYKRGASSFNLTPNFNDISVLTNNPEYFTNLIRIDFKGGEPLMHDDMYIFLEYLIKHDLAKNMEICYTTNGTKTPKILKELWPHFKKIGLSISMDGTGDVYEYIRGGNIMTLSELENSIRFFDQFENLKGGFNTTISTYNIFNMDSILDWTDTLKQKNINRFTNNARELAFGCMVTSPAYLSIQNMVPELKLIALKKIEKYNYRNLFSLKLSLSDQEYNPNEWNTFIDFTNDLDKLRNTDIKKIVPELIPYFL